MSTDFWWTCDHGCRVRLREAIRVEGPVRPAGSTSISDLEMVVTVDTGNIEAALAAHRRGSHREE